MVLLVIRGANRYGFVLLDGGITRMRPQRGSIKKLAYYYARSRGRITATFSGRFVDLQQKQFIIIAHV